ncbi:MAG TPA: hypothetical protein VF587_10920 [Solirubrobacteraceae bacterium]|jgi:hypothetical protein
MTPTRIAAALALAALALAPAVAPGQGGKPPKGPRGTAALGLEIRQPTLVFGGTVTIDGRLTGVTPDQDVVVRLEADDTKPYGDRYEDTGLTTRTAASGRYSFTHKPASNTQYRARAQASPPVASDARLVTVRYAVRFGVSDPTPRRGARVRFRGSVAPAHDGARAVIQRRTSTGSFRTVARMRLRAAAGDVSRYRRAVRIRRDGVYRVRVPGDDDHAEGFSRTRRIDAGG